MLKKFVLFSLIFTLFFGSAACGDDDPPSPPPDGGQTTKADVLPDPDDDPFSCKLFSVQAYIVLNLAAAQVESIVWVFGKADITTTVVASFSYGGKVYKQSLTVLQNGPLFQFVFVIPGPPSPLQVTVSSTKAGCNTKTITVLTKLEDPPPFL